MCIKNLVVCILKENSYFVPKLDKSKKRQFERRIHSTCDIREATRPSTDTHPSDLRAASQRGGGVAWQRIWIIEVTFPGRARTGASGVARILARAEGESEAGLLVTEPRTSAIGADHVGGENHEFRESLFEVRVAIRTAKHIAHTTRHCC